jgi:GT2 family glycosyltransferase
MDQAGMPLITVIISTCCRSESLARTVRSVLLNDYPRFNLKVIDQSEGDVVRHCLLPFLGDPRLEYCKSETRGLSAGLNVAISRATSELIAVIDDDCEAPANWVFNLARSLLWDRRVGAVFGNVLAAPHDPRVGFIPAYRRREPFVAHNLWQNHRIASISASMGLRRSIWERLGGFDELLGPGAPFKSAEETDFVIRTLRAGYFVYETPDVSVIHHGFRTWGEGRELIRAYLYGIGAMFAKHFKSAHASVMVYCFQLAWRWAFEKPLVDFGHNPSRGLRLRAFLEGFSAGIAHPVCRSAGLYMRRNNSH